MKSLFGFVFLLYLICGVETAKSGGEVDSLSLLRLR